ncbi:hypothetical protein NDU88_002885 [Pleurodeles waltl]|uniref:Uncharacterized protein n=1 Tax=Pleurodeles waltl TaxID=8319 RepID=A0AAV7MQQ2_PLEWA|nr:hypothetical protein NDU88_002885 [Pleurodeles waltl]
MQPDFATRRSTQHQSSDQKFDTRPNGSMHSQARTTQPDFQSGIDAAAATTARPTTADAPPTGWRCIHGHSDRGGTAAVRNGKPAVPRRFPAALGNPPWRRCRQRRHGDSDPLTASLALAVLTARTWLAVTGVAGPLGAPAVPMPLAWALQGPPNRAPPRFSVSAKQTLKIATGATAPVAPLPLRRLHSEPASSWKGVSCWAGGRPPAQRETQNYRGGLLTAQRYSEGGTLAGGLRRPPKSE